MRINLEGRLLHVDEKGLIEGFQNRPGKQDWIGEHAGKFLDAAANTGSTRTIRSSRRLWIESLTS